MGTNKRSELSSDRQKWDKIFNGLVRMLQTQQTQLETLVKERKLLEERVRVQHERWVSDIRLYKDHIAQMKEDMIMQEKIHSLEAAKSDLVMNVKNSTAFLEKLMLEDADSELADFKAWFDYVSHKFSDPKVLSLTNGSDIQGEERNSKTMEGEVRRLQHEYEKLASEKSSELSTLLAENKFVWNQYKIMENDYTSKLRSEHSEVELANEKIKKLLASVEQLQSLNDEKDETIATLRTKVYKKEADSNKLNEENLRLSQELDLLKKSRSSLVTPVLNRCTAGAQPFCLRDKNSIRDRSNVIVKKESSAAQAKDTEKGGRGSKRKSVDSVLSSAPPNLFSSNFKVPKLKTLSQ
ncbi:ERC protein 2 isoform X1 [Fagus crenata]